jgi:hypothetical protein
MVRVRIRVRVRVICGPKRIYYLSYDPKTTDSVYNDPYVS